MTRLKALFQFKKKYIINANHYLPLDSLYVSKYCKCKQLFYKYRLNKKKKTKTNFKLNYLITQIIWS